MIPEAFTELRPPSEVLCQIVKASFLSSEVTFQSEWLRSFSKAGIVPYAYLRVLMLSAV
jgi:hypothetical protein